MGDTRACRCLEAILCGVDEGLAVIAANALRVAGSPVAEEALVRALLVWEPNVRCAAVRAQAHIGHLASLAPLHALIEKSTTSPELASDARQAIAAIRSRIPGASPGQVSLAAGEQGRLAIASDDRAGAVTISSENGCAPQVR
jgi:hypothetical protein